MAQLKDLLVGGSSRFIGPVYVDATPTNNIQIANKKYVDDQVATRLATNGKAASATLADTATYATTADSATTATKLSNTSAIGSATAPIYFTENGVPATCTHTLEKSVSSSAALTDQNVAQTAASDNLNYPILFASNTSPSTSGTKYNTNMTINPSTQAITAKTFNGGLSYLTTAPNANNADGNIKFVILDSEPSTKYSGYIYIITTNNS